MFLQQATGLVTPFALHVAPSLLNFSALFLSSSPDYLIYSKSDFKSSKAPLISPGIFEIAFILNFILIQDPFSLCFEILGGSLIEITVRMNDPQFANRLAFDRVALNIGFIWCIVATFPPNLFILKIFNFLHAIRLGKPTRS